MIEININKLRKSFGFGNIFNDISFELKTGERVGLVGSNGSGKSTLLKLITKEYFFDSGDISIRSNATIGHLKQEIILEEDNVTVKDILYRSVKDILEIENKLRKYELEMQKFSGEKLNKLLIKYSNLLEKFQNIGCYEISEKIGRIIKGFKLESIINSRFNILSGGEKRIVNLASIMINNPNILLLDEPTNHLDIETLEWFEEYLSNYKGTVLIVSHDRYFLNKVTNKTILIENGNNYIFNGNYNYYLEENEKRILLEYEQYKNQQKKISNMKNQIKQLREWGKIGDNERFFKRAINIEKRLEKMNILSNPEIKKELSLVFNIENRSGNEVLKLKKYSLSIGDIELMRDSNLTIMYKDRVCLIGKNGSGKTTLIRNILNTSNNDNIILGSNIIMGYIPQDIVFDNSDITVLDYARKYFIGEESYLRSTLTRFMFYSDSVFKRIKNLSGGEKIRLKLFELIQSKCNFIILDEPTNHIDIETKEVLEEALLEYQGTLLFISHDRYFINKIATKIVAIEDKKLNLYIGNYDEYVEKKFIL